MVEGDRRLHHVPEACIAGVLALRPLVELHARPAGELRQGLGEGQAVALHDEREDVAVLATAEAVPRVADGRHDEAGRLLAMEGAQPLEGGPRLLQLDRLPHHVRDGEPALDLGHDADAQGHPFRIPAAGDGSDRKWLEDLSSLDRPPAAEGTPGQGG